MNLSLPAGQRVGCELRGRVWGPVDRFLPRDSWQDAARDGAETFPRATDLRSLSQCCARYSCVLPSSLQQRHCVVQRTQWVIDPALTLVDLTHADTETPGEGNQAVSVCGNQPA